jgi:hypothetical protein
LSNKKQSKAEQLLATRKVRRLTKAERQQLNDLLREYDALMLRRADAMERV